MTSQRKFTLALLFTVTGSIALLMGEITGGEYAALAGLVLGAYGVSNVMDKRNA